MSERDAKILALYQSGAMIKDIAAAVGLVPNSMVGILRRLGIERPVKAQRRWRDNPDESRKIIDLWNKGLCASQIAERVNVSRETIDHAIRAAGIDRTTIHRTRYDGAALGGSGRSGFAANMARRT